MKYIIYPLLAALALLFFCGGKQEKKGYQDTTLHQDTDLNEKNAHSEAAPVARQGQVCWKGTLGSKTNVLLHYQIEDKVLVGEIIYLDTKARRPIKVIGTIEEAEDWREYRLLEFEVSGNVTGIITGLPTEDEFTGSWFSPKTRKDLTMDLKRVDTLISKVDLGAKPDAVAGKYYYQYSKQGPQGELKVSKVDAGRVAFSIDAVTGEPARNMATVDRDTVVIDGNGFIYKVPDTDNCGFRVRFCKDFALISYTKDSDCRFTFGHNATVEGIYYKVE